MTRRRRTPCSTPMRHRRPGRARLPGRGRLMNSILVQEQHLPGRTLQEKWDAAQRYGYDGIELRGQGDLQFAARLPELRKAARRRGTDADRVRRDAALHRRLRRRPAAATRSAAEVPAVGDRGDRRRRRDDPRFLRDVLPPAAPVRAAAPPGAGPPDAARRPRRARPSTPRAEGVTLFLEPLNRYEDHMVNRLEEAVSLCGRLGLASVRLVHRHLPHEHRGGRRPPRP